MKKDIFTYYDSESGLQLVKFTNLSELIKYLRNFKPKGNSEGVIYKNGQELITYESENNSLTFYGPMGWQIG